MKIRKATLEDATALAELSIQLGYPTSSLQASDRLRMILESNEHAVIVACKDDDSVVGWIHVFLTLRVESDPFAELGGFVVEEQHRGCGAGRRLLAAVEKWVIDRGAGKLRVRCQLNRFDAHRFYERLGFSRIKEQLVFDKPMDTG